MTSVAQCFCLVFHANTEQEREQAKEALESARRVSDTLGIIVAIARLNNSQCPARPAAVQP